MKYIYRQWQWKGLVFGLGFDPEEWAQVRFIFDVCFQHKEAQIELYLLGGMIDLGFHSG